LRYLASEDFDGYQDLVKRLGLKVRDFGKKEEVDDFDAAIVQGDAVPVVV